MNLAARAGREHPPLKVLPEPWPSTGNSNPAEELATAENKS